MSDRPNKIIAGKYQIVRPLGQGSFGTVYLVRHVDLGVHYALKLLKKNFSTDETFLERFRREAEILLRFSHPGSVQVRDFGKTEDGLYYMALDFCQGDLLEELLLRDGALSLFDTLELMLQILAVLEAAHSVGIIHRDIKSANVIIERTGDGSPFARILDFGIAKLKDDGAAAGTKMTVDGAAIGTPDYMSPEQASGAPDLDCRVDIYASGVLMYEMITGNVPFKGSNIMQTLLKHLTQPVPPFPPELHVPQFIFDIVAKAMEKEREKRYSSAAEFRVDCLAAIERLKSELSKKVEEPSPAPQPPVPVQQPAPATASDEKKILCLDDNEMILQIVRHIFEKEGYKVFIASSFSGIHDYIFNEKVPLMLCDVNLPGLPGPKICRMLKQAHRKLKIILFSNIDERDLEKLAISCRADAWLSKNTTPDAWLTKVREVEATIKK